MPKTQDTVFDRANSIHVLGVEACADKSNISESLAVELIDQDRRPPNGMIAATKVLRDTFWEVVPSTTTIPFVLKLPGNMGPQPCE